MELKKEEAGNAFVIEIFLAEEITPWLAWFSIGEWQIQRGRNRFRRSVAGLH